MQLQKHGGALSVNFILYRPAAFSPSLQSPSDVRTEADLHHLDEAILFSCSACASLTKGARLALARVATQASFEEGSVLCQAGRPMDRVFFIINGQVRLRSQSHEGLS